MFREFRRPEAVSYNGPDRRKTARHVLCTERVGWAGCSHDDRRFRATLGNAPLFPSNDERTDEHSNALRWLFDVRVA